MPLSDGAILTPIRASAQNVPLDCLGDRLRILVVDDNVDAADALAMLLELENHRVKVVNSGIEALLAAAEFKPDIVFLDIGMPGMNGYEVAKALQKLPEVGRRFWWR